MDGESDWTDAPAYRYTASPMEFRSAPEIDSSEPLETPRSILDRLAGVRRKARFVDLVLGLARVGLVVLGVVCASFILDYLLETPVGFRATVLVIAAVLVVWAGVRFVAAPLLRRLSDDDVALLVEETFPELEDELISAVQLSRARSDRERGYASEDLCRAVVREASDRAGGLAFGKAVRAWPALQLALLVLLVGGVVGMAFASQPALAGTFVRRSVLLEDVLYPRKIRIEVEDHPEFVARGDDLEVAADVSHVSGGQVFGARILARFDSLPDTVEEEPMVGSGGAGRWRHVFRNITEPFEYAIVSGDARTTWRRVEVRARPEAEGIRFRATFPEATRREPDDLTTWNLEVPAGTVLEWTATANRDLDPDAPQEILFEPADAVEVVGERALSLEGSRELSGTFRVLETVRYGFRLVDVEGLDTGTPSRYDIRAIPDEAPSIRVERPRSTRDRQTAAATIPVRAVVQDDHGVRDAWIEVEVRDGESEGEPPRRTLDIRRDPTADDETEVPVEITLALEDLELRTGDEVRFAVRADDFAGQEGSSDIHRIQIVDRQTMSRRISRGIAHLRDELRDIVRMEEGTRDDVQEVATATRDRGAEALDDGERRQLAVAEMDQQRVTRRLRQAGEEAARLGDLAERNEAGGPDAVERLEEIRETLDRLSSEDAPAVTRELTALRGADELDRGRLESVPVAQQGIVDDLEELIRRIESGGRFSEILQSLRSLLDRQENIQEGTRRRAREDIMGR